MSPINKVIKNSQTDLNPIWIMRQAGRYLPEFREIRSENPDFIKLCLNKNLTPQITFTYLINCILTINMCNIVNK